MEEWSDDFTRLTLWEKIRFDKENDPSFEMMLFYYRSGIFLKSNVPVLLREMLQFFQKSQGMGVSQKYEMYKVSHEIFEYYEESSQGSDSILHIVDIVEAEHSYHEFYILMDELLVQMAQFWKEISTNKYKITSQAEEVLEHVIKIQSKLKKTMKNLSEYKIEKQIKLYNMINEMINSYTISKSSNTEEASKQEKSSSFEYIVLEK